MPASTRHTTDGDVGKEANVLILELDKGLQSFNLGEQCKAIAQFPNLLEKYPFPAVINSVFMKITQIFCLGNNYLRLCVLRACYTCREHLEKLTICDDVVRKLMEFTTSNDPVTRALTLRIFGTLNLGTREHVGVHHAILKALDSHYAVESDAAIWSSHRLASSSSSFAISLCPILCQRLLSFSTDLDVKLKLTRLGRHMHHDIVIFEEMRRCLVEMLSVYTTTDFVICILDTVTHLDSFAPIHSDQQLDLLINYLTNEDRQQVQRKVWTGLTVLASKVPHHWEARHTMRLCSIYLSNKDSNTETRESILNVFMLLASSLHTSEILQHSLRGEGGMKQCVKMALSTFPTTKLTLKAICLASMLLTRARVDQSEFFSIGQLVCFLVAHFTFKENDISKPPWFLSPEAIPLNDLKQFYVLIAQLFDAYPEYLSSIYKMNLFERVRLGGNSHLTLLCQFLTTLFSRKPSAFLSPSPTADRSKRLLAQLCTTNAQRTQDPASVECVLSVCGLLFLTCNGIPLDEGEQNQLLRAIAMSLSGDVAVPSLDTWLVYQLARQSSRYGQHALASRLYGQLSTLVCSERATTWLMGLTELSRAEAELIHTARRFHSEQPVHGWLDSLTDALRLAADATCRTRTTFIGVGGPDIRWFQAEYTRIRSDLYLCLAELCTVVRYHMRALNTQIDSSSLKGEKGSAESAALPAKCFASQISLWNSLWERISNLRAQCLDADQASLDHLFSLLELVAVFTRFLNSPDADDRSTSETSTSLSAQPKTDPFSHLIGEIHQISQTGSWTDGTYLDMLARVALRVAQTPSHWPRFFFQRLQTSSVRLILPNADTSADGIMTISSGVGHMVPVMGVVHQRSRLPHLLRRIRAVEVNLVVTESSAHSKRHHRKPPREEHVVFQSKHLAQLQRDYFHCEFCIRFPIPEPLPSVDQVSKPDAIVYRVQATSMLFDSTGTSWQLTAASGASTETTFLRVESNTHATNTSSIPLNAPAMSNSIFVG